MNEGIVLNRTFVNVVVKHSRDEYVVLLWVLPVVAFVQFKRIQTLDCYHDMIMKSITVRKQLIWPSDIQPHQQQLWIEAHYLLTRGSQSILWHCTGFPWQYNTSLSKHCHGSTNYQVVALGCHYQPRVSCHDNSPQVLPNLSRADPLSRNTNAVMVASTWCNLHLASTMSLQLISKTMWRES